MVYPAQIKNVVETFIPKTTGEFRILLDEPPPRVVPPLKLKIEFGPNIKKDDLAALNKELEERFHREVKIRPKIEWIEPQALERSAKKTKYIGIVQKLRHHDVTDAISKQSFDIKR